MDLRSAATSFHEYGELHEIEDFIVHNNFNLTSLDNDIALIKVSISCINY